MTEEQLQNLEKKFGVTLPRPYRSLLSNPPRLLMLLLEWDDSDNHESQTPLFRSPALVAGINEECRDLPSEDFVYDYNDPNRPWPNEYFIIGGTAGGDHYCVKSESSNAEIFFWRQGDAEFEKCCDSIHDFVKHIFSHYAEVATWDLKE